MISLISKQRFPKTQNLYKFSSFILFLVCLILDTGCVSDEEHYAFQGELREFVHQNDLVIKLPKTFVAQAKENGFLIEPADASNHRLRNSLMVWIEKRDNEEPIALANMREKRVGNRTLNYQIEMSEGGSGGDEYYFTAWEKIDRNFIVYKQTLQSEHGEPAFATCWQIVEKTAIKK